MEEHNQGLRNLPSVDKLADAIQTPRLTHMQRVDLARRAIDLAREKALDGEAADPSDLVTELILADDLAKPKEVINGTGVILHTNLGRAPLSKAATEAASRASSSYTNTEFDLSQGARGSRGEYTRRLLKLLTGAEDALVVNNNAATVLLTLATFATGRSVPISRGELIEIGGSYRLPEVMAASGANMVEVGTTNRTRPSDYVTALQIHDCGVVLKIHPSNYEVSGFTSEANIRQLAEIAEIPLVFDLGSGLLDNTTPWLKATPSWLVNEPGVRQALQDGADLVLFSGDKMLGGPQAGIIVGARELVSKLRTHPLARALRVSAATDAALAATLESYVSDQALTIPFWRMVTLTRGELHTRAERLAESTGGTVEVGDSIVGAGSATQARLESPIVRFSGKDHLYAPLLEMSPPLLTRRDHGDLLIDLRTVEVDSDEVVDLHVRQCL